MQEIILPIMVFSIPIIAIVMRNLTKWREMQAQSMNLNGSAAGDLLHRADRLEQRVQQLERLLDAESPGWRARA
ncbi:MAG: envelope stress response membrane protein PspB [Azospirillaceae bacterium]|nr:envelope stress response membrane protein PspB [Azospirillaceae bacterium]